MPSSEERKLLILKAATRLFARQGYDATTLAQIAKASGASVGSIVNFFLDKPHLALRVRDSALAHLAAVVGTALHRPHRDVGRAAAAAIGAYFDWVNSNPEMAILVQDLGVSRAEQGGGLTAAACLLPVFEAWAAGVQGTGRLLGSEPRYLVAVILGPAMTLVAAQAAQQQDDLCQSRCVADFARAAASALRAGSKDGKSPKRANTKRGSEAGLNVPSPPARPGQLSLL